MYSVIASMLHALLIFKAPQSPFVGPLVCVCVKHSSMHEFSPSDLDAMHAPELSIWALLVRGVQEDASVEQRAMHVCHHAAGQGRAGHDRWHACTYMDTQVHIQAHRKDIDTHARTHARTHTRARTNVHACKQGGGEVRTACSSRDNDRERKTAATVGIGTNRAAILVR